MVPTLTAALSLTDRFLEDASNEVLTADHLAEEQEASSVRICSVLNGLEVVRLVSGNTRNFFKGAIEDVEFLREYMTEAMMNGGIVGGFHTSLDDLAATLDWRARNLTEGMTTVDANLGYSDDRPDRRVERYVGTIHEPFVGSKEADLAMCDVLSNMLPWITDRQSKEDSWWLDHQNGRSEGLTKETPKVDRLYAGVWIVSYGEALLYYPPLTVYGHPLTIGDIFGNEYDSRSEGVIPPYYPWNDPTKEAKFSSPYPDIAVPGLSMITAGAPVHYTGEWYGYTYDNTYVGTIGIDITIDSLSALLDDLDGTLTEGSFAFLVDADFSVIVISQSNVERLFPERTGMEEARITYDKTTGEVLQDRRNQTYMVSDTIVQPLTNLTNANWMDLQATVFNTNPGGRGYSEMNVTLTGDTNPTSYYVMYERWPNIADWAMLAFAPVQEVDNAIRVSFAEDQIALKSHEGAGDLSSQALFVNEGSLDVMVSLKSLPDYIQLHQPLGPKTIVEAGSSFPVDFSVLTDKLDPGKTATLITMTVEDAFYTECFYSHTHSFEVVVEIEEVEASERFGSGHYLAVALACLFAAVVAVLLCLRRKKNRNDNIWKIKRDELQLSDPPEIVGRGSYGYVLKAHWRGTWVAVKRVLPPKAKHNKGSKDRSAELSKAFNDDTMMNSSFIDKSKGDQEQAQTGLAAQSSVRRNSWTQSGGNFGMMSIGYKSLTGTSRVGALGYFTGANTEKAALRKLEKDFVDEMRVLSKLRHPNVTTIMGAVLDKNGDSLMVMEYMFHGSLFDLLHNETMVLEADILLPILRDIVQGGRFLHAGGHIHADLKAANILVDDRFRAKCADFGLSRKRQMEATGTPFWMAPELLRRESTNTTASDVYAFGIILHEVFSRKEPYCGEDPREVLRLVADRKVQKRPTPPDNCPAQIQSMMNDCLVDDPSCRPTFEELAQRLQRIDAKTIEAKKSPSLHHPLKKSSTVSLDDIFPPHVAEALKEGRKVEAEHHDVVTIFFSDIVGFTTISSQLQPSKVANLLHRFYGKLDQLSSDSEFDVFKVETIGDAYMATTNLVKDQSTDHAKRMAAFAVECIRAANETLIDEDDTSLGCLNIRIGLHSGPVVADVVGSRNPRYCLFGDTVNTASRMESISKKNCINCSERAAELLREQGCSIPLTDRGMISVKGKGDMRAFWLGNVPASGRGSTMTDVVARGNATTVETLSNDDLSVLRETSECNLDQAELGILEHCGGDHSEATHVST